MNTEQFATSNIGNCKHYCGIKCISWSAIIIAAFVALGLSFLLNLFSTAIGLSIYKVNPEGVSQLAIGGMLGFAIGIIIIMFFSGWVAGYFGRSHCDKKCCGALYGFAAWSIALVLMVMLALPFSHFVTTYTHYLANTSINATTDTISLTNTNKTITAAIPNETTLDDLSKGTFVLFLMFFLGALASTCGGHVGVLCCQHNECCTTGKCNKCN